MNTNGKNYDIVSGPSRDMLFDAFKYAYDKTAIVQVQFDIAIGYSNTNSGMGYYKMKSKDFKIVSIEHEDGSGYSFNLRGYCSADTRFRARDAVEYATYKFKAYYNAKTRKGYITLTET